MNTKIILSLMLLAMLITAAFSEDNKDNTSLESQILQLKERITRLEKSMNASSDSSMSGMNMGGMNADSMQSSDSSMNMGMGMMGMMKKNMGMMKKDMGMMGMMKKNKGMGMMGGKMDMGNMMMMGMAGSDQQMTMTSALPGFPGASHIYHIGTTGYFLDHLDHISLTNSQVEKINIIKEKSNLKQAEHTRAIEKAEQELWELTAADKPDAKLIKEKIEEIARHTVDKRMDFIRSVGSAAQVLTEHQLHVLQGKSNDSQVDHSSH